MDASLREMEAFLAICDKNSFTAAADELLTAQSNLSRIITGLEKRAGHKLLERSARNVSLTEEGKIFRDSARRITNLYRFEMTSLDERLTAANDTVRLALLPSVASAWAPQILARLHTHFPHAVVDFFEGRSEQVTEAVEMSRADLGVSFDMPTKSGIHLDPYLVDRFVALIPDGHDLAAESTVKWSRLAEHTFVFLPRGTSVRTLTDSAFAQSGSYPAHGLTASSIAVAAGMVAERLGITAVPSLSLGLFDYPGIRKIQIRQPQVARRLHLIYSSLHNFNRATHQTLKALRELRETEAALPFGATWAP